MDKNDEEDFCMQCTIFMHVEQEMMRNMAPPKHACAKLAACLGASQLLKKVHK